MCKRPPAPAAPRPHKRAKLGEWPLFGKARAAARKRRDAVDEAPRESKRRRRDESSPERHVARCDVTGARGADDPEADGSGEAACPPCAPGPEGPVRRQKNRHVCDGRGGCPVGAGCNAVFTQLFNLRNHKHQNRRTCGVCGKVSTQEGHFYTHFRKAHPQLLDAQGGCAVHGVPPRTVRRTLPEASWKARLDAVDARHGLAPGTTWIKLTKGGGYSELMRTVRDCAKGDTRKRKLTAAQRANAARLETDPVRKHALAQQIMEYVIERELLWPGATDDLGGFVRSGLKLRAHAGLWGLSLDRRDNGEPHFAVPCEASEPRLVEGYGGTGSARGSQAMVSAYRAVPPPAIGPETNLRAVAAGMNTRSNPGDHWDGATCARLRAEMARPVTEAMAQSAIAAEAQTRDGGTNTILYRSTMGAFKDPKAKADFGTVAAMFLYTKELLSNQGARCAVSGILLRGLSGPVEERVFRMSVDAIDPLKGHVRGNLRLICQFLQAGACDKRKKMVDADDGPSQWTKEMFREYAGINTLSHLCINVPGNGRVTVAPIRYQPPSASKSSGTSPSPVPVPITPSIGFSSSRGAAYPPAARLSNVVNVCPSVPYAPATGRPTNMSCAKDTSGSVPTLASSYANTARLATSR